MIEENDDHENYWSSSKTKEKINLQIEKLEEFCKVAKTKGSVDIASQWIKDLRCILAWKTEVNHLQRVSMLRRNIGPKYGNWGPESGFIEPSKKGYNTAARKRMELIGF
tara:strand:+ start:58 stop:384 length:327 start_codon:yes stop_codon:yes gene_type:complete